MLKNDLQKKRYLKKRVQKCNGEIKNENGIFEKRLFKYLDQKEPVTYQCSLCEFRSGYRDKITKHRVKKHMTDCKGPDPVFTVGTSYIFGMCGKCMTQDSPDLEFSAAITHVGGPSLDKALKLHSESGSDCK